jgi:hypothetical protein
MGSLGKLGCVICWLVAFRYAWVLSRMARRLHPRASNRQGAATTTNHRFAKTPQSFQSRCDTGESPGSVLPSCCLRNVPSAIPQLKSPICRHFLYSENAKHLLFVPHRPLGH